MSNLTSIFRVRGSHAPVVREFIERAARELGVVLFAENGRITFDNDEIALKVMTKAVELSGARLE